MSFQCACMYFLILIGSSSLSWIKKLQNIYLHMFDIISRRFIPVLFKTRGLKMTSTITKQVLSPKESGEFIIQHAKDVSIGLDGVKACGEVVISAFFIIFRHLIDFYLQ